MRQAPAYCVHMSRNLAFVRLSGRMVLLSCSLSERRFAAVHSGLDVDLDEKRILPERRFANLREPATGSDAKTAGVFLRDAVAVGGRETREKSHGVLATRNPTLLLLKSGVRPVRAEARHMLKLLYQSPPRTTRLVPVVGPSGLF